MIMKRYHMEKGFVESYSGFLTPTLQNLEIDR